MIRSIGQMGQSIDGWVDEPCACAHSVDRISGRRTHRPIRPNRPSSAQPPPTPTDPTTPARDDDGDARTVEEAAAGARGAWSLEAHLRQGVDVARLELSPAVEGRQTLPVGAHVRHGWLAGWLAGVKLDWKEGGGGLDRSDGDPKGCAVNQWSRSNRSRRPGRSIGRSRRPGGCVSYGPPPCFFGLIEGRSEHGLNRGAESSLRKPAPGQPASRPAPPSARPRNENRASGVGRMHACRPAG